MSAAAQAINAIGHALGGPMQALSNTLFTMGRAEPARDGALAIEPFYERLRTEVDRFLLLPRAYKRSALKRVSPSDVVERVRASLPEEEKARLEVSSSGPDVALEHDRLCEAALEMVRRAIEHAPARLVLETSERAIVMTVEGNDVAIEPLVTAGARTLDLGLATAFAFADRRGGDLVWSERKVTLRVPVPATEEM